MQRRSILLFIPIVTGIITMTLLMFGLMNGWLGEAGKTATEFCEASRDHLIKQPANSWSNLSFTFVGWLIGWHAFKNTFARLNNRMSNTFFYPCFMATVIVLIGTGSMAMHASTSITGGYFDMLSMYLMAALMFAYAFIRYFNLNALSFFLAFLLVLLLTHILHFANHFHGPVWGFIDINITFAIFAVTAILLEFAYILNKKPEINTHWILRFSTLFLFSFLIWNLSRTGNVLCDPGSLLQGHAAWHIMDAVCLYFLYRYYVSERLTVEG